MLVYSTDYPNTSLLSALHAQGPRNGSSGLRTPRRSNGVVVIEDNVPVDAVPPALQVLLLTSNTVVHHPGVLPSVDTEDGLDINGTGGEVLLVRGVGAH